METSDHNKNGATPKSLMSRKKLNTNKMKTKIYLFAIIFNLFGVCNSASAQYSELTDFSGASNGTNPFGTLISDGTFLYGMTSSGGTNSNGAIFKIMPDGSGYVKIFDFSATLSGRNPLGSLIYDGTFLYGMTELGGTNDMGTIFKIMPNGSSFTKLLDFDGATNGSGPEGSLISDGTYLYGMTRTGGINDIGTIFKIMPNGSSFTKLLDFSYTLNGSSPWNSLISDGTFLYGMTEYGGPSSLGTLFKIMPNGTNFSILVDFGINGSLYGNSPRGSLIFDGTQLFGMTTYGGTNDMGIIFKTMPDGSGFNKLLDFAGASNGSEPHGSLISDGTFLYGMTVSGGVNDAGVLFKIMLNGGSYSKLFDFGMSTNGSQPFGSLFSDGTYLYGTTYDGGNANAGTVFKFANTVGVTEIAINNSLNIFPNPTNGFFTLQTADTQLPIERIAIFNVLGEKIYLMDNTKLNKITIDLSTQPSGIYFVEIYDRVKIYKEEIVIQ